MKYQKATVTVINLGNEDILTCSGEPHQITGCNQMMGFYHGSYPTFGHSHTGHSSYSGGGIWGFIYRIFF